MLARHIAKQALLMRSAANNGRRSYQIAGGRKSTMNDLPVPSGDWQERYSRLNSRYNAILLLGIATFATTIGLVRSTNIVELNYSPPQSLD